MSNELDSNDIRIRILKDIYARKEFIGVFPRNQLPLVQKEPFSFICNTDPSTKPGEHWIAMHFDRKKRCTFFDSFGLPPDYYNLKDYIEKLSVDYEFNKRQLQDFNSSLCGHFCCVFILLKSRGLTLDEINKLYSLKNLEINDLIVMDLFKKFK